MSRGFVDDKTNSLIAAFRYPGRIGFLGRMDLATGKLTPLTDLDGMMLYKVTSVAFDPSTRTAFYTNQNYAYRDINAIDVDTGKKRRLLTDARIGDLAFNQADKSLWGIRHQNGFVDPGPDPAALHQLQPDQDLPLRRDHLRPRRLARWRAGLRVLRHGRRQAVGQGVEALRSRAGRCRQSGHDAVARAVDAGEFHLHAGRQGAARQCLLYRRLERLPARYRDRQI